MMDFDCSTQARSWLFSESTLLECRKQAVKKSTGPSSSGVARVRKFASGFRRRHLDAEMHPVPPRFSPVTCGSRKDLEGIEDTWFSCPSESISWNEQESLVRYHAHHLRMLIGPSAVLRGLVRNSSVLATAITLLRRFYLSNSVMEFDPWTMAVASAFLAAKLEDARVEVSSQQSYGDGYLRSGRRVANRWRLCVEIFSMTCPNAHVQSGRCEFSILVSGSDDSMETKK